MAASLADKLGDGLCEAVAGLLQEIEAESSFFREENHKFIAEAILATALVATPRALALNRRLGDSLFSADLGVALLRNPGNVVMYMLPLRFAQTRPPAQGLVESLFRRLHESGSTKGSSYPSYRNEEIDYLYARLIGRDFHNDPFAGIAMSFPWTTRDSLYGLTHLHFYNSDFCRHAVRYPAPADGIMDALVARTWVGQDHDLLLELLLCRLSMNEADAARSRFHDHLVALVLRQVAGVAGRIPADRPFRESYHLLLLAWIYLALRGDDFRPRAGDGETARIEMLGDMMVSLQAGAFLEFFGGYAAYIDAFGQNPAIEGILPLYGEVVRAVVDRPRHGLVLPVRPS